MKFSFLIENKTDNPGITAEHGLSIYIESHGRKILFDGGASDLVIANAKAMDVKLQDVDFAVVSHGHYDHTGAFPEFCRINAGAPIYIHKNALREAYGTENGEIEKENCGIRWTDGQLDDMRARLHFTEGPLRMDEDIVITGTVPVGADFKPTEAFYYVSGVGDDGERLLEADDMSHEQCLVIREADGLYIFSGCSHRGAVNALNAGKAMFPGERVAAFIAGMHLYSASDEDRKRVIDEIASEDMDIVMPVHCTGIEAICELKTRLGDKCIAATAGDVYER